MKLIRLQKKALLIADACLIVISFTLALLLKYDARFESMPFEIPRCGALILAAMILIKLSLFYLLRHYDSILRFAGMHEMIVIITSAFISNAAIFGAFKILGAGIPESVFVITFLTDVFLIGGSRFAYRSIRRIKNKYLYDKEGAKRILIIGNGETGAVLVKEFKENPNMKCVPVAIVDDDKTKAGKEINGVPIAGQIQDIKSIIREKRIDEVIIALTSFTRKTIENINDTCSELNCEIKIVPSFMQLLDRPFAFPEIRSVNLEDLLGREPIDLNDCDISDCLKDKVVLVTGGGGSIGSELSRQIILYKPKLLVLLDNYENNVFEVENDLNALRGESAVVVVIANIREKQRLENVFERYRPEIVFHAAAHKHVGLMETNPGEAIKNNVFGTLNLANCSEKFGVKKFVLISTDKAVKPTSVMGATKRVAEMIIQSLNARSNTEFSSVRFGNVLGSSGSVIPIFRKQIERGGPVTVTDRNATRYFMTISEAAHLVIHAAAIAKGGEVFVLDMGEPINILGLAKKYIKLCGYEPDADIMIKFTGLRPAENLHEELLLPEEDVESTKNNKIFVTRPVFADYDMLLKKIENITVVDALDRNKTMDYLTDIISMQRQGK